MGMMINRRRAYGGKKGLLPSEYKQLEWIENTSDAYILLNYNASLDTELVTDIIVNDNTLYYIAGSRRDMNTGVYAISYVKNPKRLQFVYIAVSNGATINVGSETNLHIEVDNGVLKVNNDSTTWSTSEYFKSANPFTLFRCANNSSGDAVGGFYAQCCMKTTTIKENGVVLYNLIPCLSLNNEVGMYDTVTKTFFKSPNGTAFIAGPVV